uniref:Uncharacterized protein n=1 Tax=Ditylenchus dipsaci TaxID=166011 RepID=A0A915ECH9_9BILA
MPGMAVWKLFVFSGESKKIPRSNVVDLNCAVCDATADGQHFGAEACRACAAFFRRTIARRLRYVCRFDDDCDINQACRSLCRSCRLAKCYSVGMNNRAVRSQYTTTIVRPTARKTNPSHLLLNYPSTDQQPLLVSPTPIYQTSSSMSTPQKTPFLDCSSPENSSTTYSVFERKESSSLISSVNQPEDNVVVVVDDGYHKSEIASEDIVEIKAQGCFVDRKALPPTHPILAKMLIGFEGLQRRRDVSFSRARECNGYTTRIFIERQIFDVHQYYRNIRMEIEWVAEMLSTFDGYCTLPNADKVTLFKYYWIHFIVLERSFDTYRVIGPSFADMRLVFANGDILDVINCNYDLKNVSDRDQAEVKCISQPWFKRCAKEQLMPVKKLQPTEVEMIFALGLMLWKLPAEVLSELSEQAVNTAEQMANILVSELVYLIGNTEQIVLQRKEDIIIRLSIGTLMQSPINLRLNYPDFAQLDVLNLIGHVECSAEDILEHVISTQTDLLAVLHVINSQPIDDLIGCVKQQFLSSDQPCSFMFSVEYRVRDVIFPPQDQTIRLMNERTNEYLEISKLFASVDNLHLLFKRGFNQ